MPVFRFCCKLYSGLPNFWRLASSLLPFMRPKAVNITQCASNASFLMYEIQFVQCLKFLKFCVKFRLIQLYLRTYLELKLDEERHHV